METFVGDTVKILLKTSIDLTSYTVLEIHYKRPDGTHGKWTATQDGTDHNAMYYNTIDTDLDVPGTWVVQAYANGTGVVLHGKWVEFKVWDPLPTEDVTV